MTKAKESGAAAPDVTDRLCTSFRLAMATRASVAEALAAWQAAYDKAKDGKGVSTALRAAADAVKAAEDQAARADAAFREVAKVVITGLLATLRRRSRRAAIHEAERARIVAEIAGDPDPGSFIAEKLELTGFPRGP